MVGGSARIDEQASFGSWPMTPEDNASAEEDRVEVYRETAEKLRQLAADVRFDFGRREQLLALAAAFDRLATQIARSQVDH